MFSKDQSGNVAMLFGLMLPVLLVGVGGGVEVSRAVEYKQRLTSATDLACRQAEVYVESLSGVIMPSGYETKVQGYADKNKAERSLTTATIEAKPTISSVLLTAPLLNARPGNIRVTATGSLDLIFKNFLNKNSLTFTVVRDCTVDVSTSTGPATLLLSESFENYKSQLSGGWGIFSTPGLPNCESASCQGLKWATTNAGLEVDDLSAITTGDGVQYGELFAELDSDCGNRRDTTTSNQTTACAQSGQTTNSSIGMPLKLATGWYEVRYVYTARKNVDAYQYPNDSVICSSSTNTDGLQRNAAVAKDSSGMSTETLDGQTRRIELWVEPKTSGYLSDNQTLTATTNPTYMKNYMVDVCVWSKGWTERSYRFYVAPAQNQQEYRISWRAGGRDDSYGGLIDYLRICMNSCP